MTVILCRQTEMTGTCRRVFRLLHGPQRQPVNQRLLRRSLDLLQQLLQLLRMDFVLSEVNGIPEIIDKRRKLFDLLGIRVIVGTVDKRQLLPEIVLGHRLICDQHKVLNDSCRDIALVRLNLHGYALRVENDFRLRKIKINRTALHAPFPQNRGKLPHALKHRHKFLVLFSLRRIPVLENLSDTRIAHTPVYPDNRLRDRMVRYVPLCVNRHNAA